MGWCGPPANLRHRPAKAAAAEVMLHLSPRHLPPRPPGPPCRWSRSWVEGLLLRILACLPATPTPPTPGTPLLQVEQKLVEGLLMMIEGERKGDAIDRGLLKGLVRMFGSLGLYASALEPPLLQATDRYYAGGCRGGWLGAHGMGPLLLQATDRCSAMRM